ncbi:M24 family metallopeptidase [Roseovarius aestuariivivens]|uniref:M24 family metallopeptidase n=1 Tax=Roseovarius aestuariivivens TaxID=1888910 RepID=UPI001081433A|nr:Xaa-Pro peptidase family protein [Roseovarius aestuariivivens]
MAPYEARRARLCAAMGAAGLDLALICDEDNVYYLSGYYDYLHMEFGRPTILVVTRDGATRLITPAMEAEMAQARAQVDRIELWNDGMGREWRGPLDDVLRPPGRIGIEPAAMPQVVRAHLEARVAPERLGDATAVLARLRMIKSPEELRLAREAGQVAGAMMQAARDTIRAGIAEYEVALATAAVGTREAARLLAGHDSGAAMSPLTHFLQIMASGPEITQPHHRASARILQRGEPVFLCFCGMTNFHRFKLGFDRTFWVGEIADPDQRTIYELAVASQRAALETLHPGVTAERVHAAYASVTEGAGHAYPFRCGRAVGFSYLEAPQLVRGDTTVLEPGMVLAVDGSVTDPGRFRAQVGDSFIVTEDGYEQITHHPKAIEDVILPA